MQMIWKKHQDQPIEDQAEEQVQELTLAGHVEHSNNLSIWDAAEEARLVYTARLSPKKTTKLIKQKLNQEYKVKERERQ